MALLLERLLEAFELLGRRLIREANVEPVIAVEVGEVIGRDGRALGELFGAAIGRLAEQKLFDPLEGVGLHDAELVVEVFAIPAKLFIDDLLGPLVALNALTGEDLHVDDGAAHARGHAQRGVLHVRGLLTKDGTKQFLFWGQLGLALGGDLAHEHVASLHLCTDINHARLIEPAELAFRQVRDVSCDFLRPELGVA